MFQPSLGDEELAAVREVFETSWVGKGTRVQRFEQEFAEHLGVGAEHVTTMNSCTEAAYLGLEMAGVDGDCDVVLPTVSFVGIANAAAAHGARLVFCDVDPRTLNPTVEDVEAALTPKTRAVIVMHYGGYPGDIAEIARLCRDRGIFLVEDAACSVASRADGTACGVFGDFGAWSFDHGKIAVTVDGGMFYARDPEHVARAAKRAYFGMEQVSGYSQAQRTDSRWWEFEVSSFSRRATMNDVFAAIGSVQLRRLGGFLDRRREIVAHYDDVLADVAGIVLPPELPQDHRHSYYLYWVQMDERIRDAVAADLYQRGIYTTFRYPLLHRVAIYRSDARLPKAERAAEATLNLPLHQALSDADLDLITGSLRDRVFTRTAGLPRPA
ncbi:DegT/DnrJ/EryC1/StrS family aminotransferase [Saccharopolyspora sp. CA-218241]|uniref:DegT/DnrJ/EryC1/StrS family aminotransferase n=1 Tax=Saccharopolyspora sp. CA-218241 TaxID=3240027 RepID=UPI003D96DDA4